MTYTPKWTRRFLELAGLVASWSKDPSAQVGAVIVDPHRHVVGLGYNGFPAEVEDKPEWLNDREIKYSHMIHAEENATWNAGSIAGCALFVTYPCCPDCAEYVCLRGIKEVHWIEPSAEWAERWRERLERAAEVFKRYKVETFSYSVDL